MHPTLSWRHLPTRGGEPKRLRIPLSFASIAWFLTLTITPQASSKRLIDSSNPHRPLSLTWLIIDPDTGVTVNSTRGVAPRGTWWPELHFCLRLINPAVKSTPPNLVRSYGFYCCPGTEKEKYCGGSGESFCRRWSCVTSNDGDWKWPISLQDRVKFSFVNSGPGKYKVMKLYKDKSCSPSDLDYLKISFTEKGKQENIQKWINGMSWGIVFYKYGGGAGSTLTIRLRIETGTEPPVAVGPDKVLAEQGPPALEPPHNLPVPQLTSLRPDITQPPSNGTTGLIPTNTPRNSPGVPVKTGQRLFSLIQGAFQAINSTDPDATSSCWLCLSSGPPYYEGMAKEGKFNVTKEHRNQCTWGSRNKLTLTEVSGKGTCIGKAPPSHQHLCYSTVVYEQASENQYLVPGYNRWWACNTGLTPCVSTSVFNQSKDFCVMVQIIPRVYYHPEEVVLDEYDYRYNRPKREPVSLTLAVMLGLGTAVGVGTGTAALITGPQQLEKGLGELHAAMTEDLRALEESVSNLEESLTSLSEVVLQNRRGLDLLFLREGGLCAALKEECCFYVDHSGAIRDSMSKLRERLERRRREREADQGWFEGWFNRSPWMTTLLSALTGPLVVLLLLLTVGPCLINRFVAFVRERVSAVQIMVLRQQYQGLLSQGETDL
uniref:Env protein n=1 Tax=Porcine endogenous retrovirus B TaxID=194959 RepID=Q8J4V5_9GAMR|nr:env protein [Porcine endogenous retrovirus B]